MSIMSFLDTVYDTYEHSQRYGSPKNLIGDGESYNNLRYPLDVGSAAKGQYMVIHVNQETKTQISISLSVAEDQSNFQNTFMGAFF